MITWKPDMMGEVQIGFCAKTELGLYRAYDNGPEKYSVFFYPPHLQPSTHLGYCKTEQEAKARCQQHYAAQLQTHRRAS
jgi:hypothetical protein